MPIRCRGKMSVVFPRAMRTNSLSALRHFRFTLFAVLSLTIALSVRPLRADEAWSFVQITCAPELGYFSIRRFFVMDLPHMGPYLTEGHDPGRAVVTALQRKYGIFDSGGLQANPFECSIPQFQAVQGWGGDDHPGFKVRVVGHLDKIEDMISPYTTVSLQEKSLGNIYLNGGGNIDSIEVWYDGALEVRTCREKPEISTGYTEDAVCRYEPFNAGVQ
jgi:hypothetical protein